MSDSTTYLGSCLLLICGSLGLVVVFALLMALPTMWLWNNIVVDVTKNAVTPVGFWQALGINVLCGILFKGTASSK